MTVGAQELEYPDGHTSRSIYVAMPLVSTGPHTPAEAASHLQGAHLAIWTTTPWTIPANSAVAVNADLMYAVVQAQVWVLLCCGCATDSRVMKTFRVEGWFWHALDGQASVLLGILGMPCLPDCQHSQTRKVPLMRAVRTSSSASLICAAQFGACQPLLCGSTQCAHAGRQLA